MIEFPGSSGRAAWFAAWVLLVTAPMSPAQMEPGESGINQPPGAHDADMPTPVTPPPSIQPDVKDESAPTGAVPDGSGQVLLHVREFRFTGNKVITTAQLQTVAAPYQDREITDIELQELRRKLTALYTKAGYVTSSVVVPDQEIVDGVITLEAVEGRLGAIELRGVENFNQKFLTDWIASGIDAPVNARQVEEHLFTMLMDPAITGIKPQLIVGDEPGTSNLRVDVEEARQFGARVSMANDRSPAVGGIRGELELMARNLLGRGDFTSVSVEGSQGLQVVDVYTDVPLNVLGTRLQFRFSDYDLNVIEEPQDALNIESETRIVEVALQQALYRSPRRNISATISVEGSDSDSFLDGRRFSFSPGAENGHTQVRAARMTLAWVERWPRNVISAQAQFSVGLNILNATVHEDDRPDSEFHTGYLDAQWLHTLPQSWGQFYSRFRFQKANDTLLPVEKISIGGLRSVRGYRRTRFIRDSAWDGSIEYRVPLIRLPVPGLSAGGEGKFSAVAFVDAGRAWNEENGEDLDNATLISAGPGLRWEISRGLRAEFYWAAANRDLGLDQPDIQDRGIHFHLGYQTRF